MSIHTSVFYSVVATDVASAAEPQTVAAVTDQTLAIRNDALVPSRPVFLLAAAAAGGGGALSGGNLQVARLRSPKTVISPVYINPVNNVVGSRFGSDPNVSSFTKRPFAFREGEEISAEALAVNVTPATTTVAVIVWMSDRIDQIPDGEEQWVSFSANPPSVFPSSAAWTTVPMQFTDSTTLPAGRYAIVGMHIVRSSDVDNFICARLVIPGESFRPGIMTSPTFEAIVPTIADSGSFGVWGVFDAQLPPSIDLFGTGVSTGPLTGYLKVIQLPR
jgi:hypothetical protein